MLDKLLLSEERRNGHPLYSFGIIPIKTFDELIKKYDIFEFTEHWYDGPPRECYECNHNKDCDKCVYIKEWEGSYEQLTSNNWIDVYGPGMWGSTQDDANRMVKEIFETEILKDKEFEKRLFWYQPPADRSIFYLFYLNRDRKQSDYWFVFKRRTSPK